MTTDQNKAVVWRFNKQVIEERNTNHLEELFQPDFINRTAKFGQPAGVDGMLSTLELLWKAFSGMRVEILDQVAENDKVTTRKIIHGTHTGTFMNKEATNKPVEFHIIDIVRLSNGKYAEHWSVIDMQRVLAQIEGNKV